MQVESHRPLRCVLPILVAFASAPALAAKPIVIPGLEGPFAGGNFVIDCGFTRRLSDDPIVSPGIPGAAHDHSFFGNETTRARSRRKRRSSTGRRSVIDGRTAPRTGCRRCWWTDAP